MANDPVKVFIGTSANGEDAKIEMAYEHSIRKNCSREVDIIWMRQTNDCLLYTSPSPRDATLSRMPSSA